MSQSHSLISMSSDRGWDRGWGIGKLLCYVWSTGTRHKCAGTGLTTAGEDVGMCGVHDDRADVVCVSLKRVNLLHSVVVEHSYQHVILGGVGVCVCVCALMQGPPQQIMGAIEQTHGSSDYPALPHNKLGCSDYTG